VRASSNPECRSRCLAGRQGALCLLHSGAGQEGSRDRGYRSTRGVVGTHRERRKPIALRALGTGTWATEAILNHAAKGIELEDVEVSVSALEQAAEASKLS
jgi:hypothetical protein